MVLSSAMVDSMTCHERRALPASAGKEATRHAHRATETGGICGRGISGGATSFLGSLFPPEIGAVALVVGETREHCLRTNGWCDRKNDSEQHSDRRVPVTASWAIASERLCEAHDNRLNTRLQHLDSSDPNVHRAYIQEAQQECGWKHGVRSVFLLRFSSPDSFRLRNRGASLYAWITTSPVNLYRDGPAVNGGRKYTVFN